MAVLHLTVLPPTQEVKLFNLETPKIRSKMLAINYILFRFYIIIIIMIINVIFNHLAPLYKVTGSCKTFTIAIPSHSISVAAVPRHRRCRYVTIHKARYTRSVKPSDFTV